MDAMKHHGAPKVLRVDNGPEFVSKELDLWAYAHKVTLDFSRPGKPTDNAYIESFNSRFRQECLNQHWFLNMEDATSKIKGDCPKFCVISKRGIKFYPQI
jgi:putative transposase